MDGWEKVDRLMHQGALNEALLALKALPQEPKYLYRKLLILREKNDSVSFHSLLDKVLIQFPDHGSFHALDALSKHESNRVEQAMDAYETALRLDPGQPNVWSNYGLALAALNKQFEAIAAFERAITIQPDCELAWFNKGVVHERRNEFEATIQCFQKVISIESEPIDALERLGDVYFRMGDVNAGTLVFQQLANEHSDPEKSREILRALALAREVAERETASGEVDKRNRDRQQGVIAHRVMEIIQNMADLPDTDPEKSHIMNGVHGQHTARPTEGYVEHLFDAYAKTYDGHLCHVLNYKVPELLFLLCSKHHIVSAKTLDIGCGTGLCGDYFENEGLVGVDLSAAMLDRARSKAKYTELHQQDGIEFLLETTSQFDLMIAADVLVYLGDLEAFFSAAVSKLSPKGCLVFSTETSLTEDYRLSYTGRYHHHPEYVQRCSSAHGLQMIERLDASLRQEEGVWIEGQIWVLKVA